MDIRTFGVLPLALIQSLLLASGQVLLKLGLERMLPFGWNLPFWYSLLKNWQFVGCGVCYALGSLLWMYIVKNFPLSLAYPLVSLSYVFGLLAASLVFHEDVGLLKWIGVLLIIGGCCLIVK